MPHIAFDTETTGLDERHNCIIELGALALDDQLEPVAGAEPLHLLIRPLDGAVIEKGAIDTNGHTWVFDPSSAGYQAALTPKEAWLTFVRYLRTHFKRAEWLVPVGWNVPFDVRFMRALYDRTQTPTKWPFHYHNLDFLSICRYLDVKAGRRRKSYKLQEIRVDYEEQLEKTGVAHTALADVLMTLQIIKAVENDERRNVALGY